MDDSPEVLPVKLLQGGLVGPGLLLSVSYAVPGGDLCIQVALKLVIDVCHVNRAAVKGRNPAYRGIVPGVRNIALNDGRGVGVYRDFRQL